MLQHVTKFCKNKKWFIQNILLRLRTFFSPYSFLLQTHWGGGPFCREHFNSTVVVPYIIACLTQNYWAVYMRDKTKSWLHAMATFATASGVALSVTQGACTYVTNAMNMNLVLVILQITRRTGMHSSLRALA